jgi:hemoglobin
MKPTLYDKIGGKEMIEKATHYLYVNLLRNEKLSPFFADVDIKVQQRKMGAFLTYIFGGNSLYTGKSMRRVHENVVANGLNDEHVDAMIECIRETLAELKVDNNLVGEVVQMIEKHRDDVLNR